MKGSFPAKSKDFEWRKRGNAYLLLDKDTKKSFILDPVSFLVWVQCDGKTSVQEIVDVFSVGGNRDIIKTAITGVLEKMTESGVVKWV